MKQLFFAFSILFCLAATAQNDIKFKDIKHSFGKIKQNKPVTYFFSFKNTGAKPLIVESAVAGCGCTTPEYPKTPIQKGKEGKIKVTYNAAASGPFKKDVTVKFANHAEPTVLVIDGEVIVDAAKGDKPNPEH